MALLRFYSIHSAETHGLVMYPFIPMFYCRRITAKMSVKHCIVTQKVPFLQIMQHAIPEKS